MNGYTTNLLPRDVQRSRLHRRRLRSWSMTGGAYLAVLAITCGTLFISMGPRATSAQAELNDLFDQAAEFREASARIEPQLKMLKQRLESRRALAEQPDTAELLALFAGCFDNDIILRQLSLSASGVDPAGRAGGAGSQASAGAGARAGPPVPGAEREPKHFAIMLRGVSRSEGGVSRLSDKLKALDIFSEVELQRTGRDAMAASAVSFDVACTLREGGPPITSSGGGARGAK